MTDYELLSSDLKLALIGFTTSSLTTTAGFSNKKHYIHNITYSSPVLFFRMLTPFNKNKIKINVHYHSFAL